jgi:hypothetical protein
MLWAQLPSHQQKQQQQQERYEVQKGTQAAEQAQMNQTTLRG